MCDIILAQNDTGGEVREGTPEIKTLDFLHVLGKDDLTLNL